MEKSLIVVHLHTLCCCKNAAGKLWSPFDTHVVQKLLSGFPCFWKRWYFEVHVWSIRVQCWPDSESGRLSVRHIIRISEVRLLWFSSKHSFQLFDVFYTSTELLALAVDIVDSLVLVGQKRDPHKNRVVLCSCAGFVLLLADMCSRKSNSSSSAHWKLVS